MADGRHAGEVAVIFVSVRTADDPEGYAAAAAEMERAASTMAGYRGFVSARGEGGLGITVSYWADHGSAAAWRDDPTHAAVRAQGRARWYEHYEVVVADIARGYSWQR